MPQQPIVGHYAINENTLSSLFVENLWITLLSMVLKSGHWKLNATEMEYLSENIYVNRNNTNVDIREQNEYPTHYSEQNRTTRD